MGNMPYIVDEPLNEFHLEMLIDCNNVTRKFHEMSASKQRRASQLEKAKLLKIEAFKDNISERTANYVDITEEGKKALDLAVQAMNIHAEMLKT